MQNGTSDLSQDWLEDPKVFQVNRLAAHSDHRWYESREEMEKGEAAGGVMPLRCSLNGAWKFSYAENPDSARQNFTGKILMRRNGRRFRFPAIFRRRGMTGAIISTPCTPGTDRRN